MAEQASRSASKNSTGFVFPKLDQSLVVTAKEHSTVILTFHLNTSCNVLNDYGIEISKQQGEIRGKQCVIRVSSGQCNGQVSAYCTCWQNGTYEFKKTVDMTDTTVWIWSIQYKNAGENFTEDVSMVFNITRQQDSPFQPNQDIEDNPFSMGLVGVILGGIAVVSVAVFVVYMLCAGKVHKKGTPEGGDQRPAYAGHSGSSRHPIPVDDNDEPCVMINNILYEGSGPR
ncbi:hypothetical protein BaRGS_00024924 [Batillaria attramentaria]|uniref:Uncharacterized protein n=1 Tax=Batillaria attramentaria TaxID=370345 RepID=A0ABD0KA49_9CAEN